MAEPTSAELKAANTVFVSAVTSEFGKARDAVAAKLRAREHDVTVQSDFVQEPGTPTLLAWIEQYIRESDAVVCIIGDRSGSVPSPDGAEPYRSHLPDGIAEASYTQWELFFALHHGKNVYFYLATDGHEPDQAEPSGEDHPELQRRFVKWINDKDFLWFPFSDTPELLVGVLSANLGTVSGPNRNATMSATGADVDEAGGPAIARKRPEDANQLPENDGALIGREDDLEYLLEEIGKRKTKPVMAVGDAGVGKRALLQALTYDQRLPKFTDGSAIHPVLTGTDNAEDLRQAIWEEFYESTEPSTVSPRQRLKDLKDIEALVFLPDIDDAVGVLKQIVDDNEMQHMSFCISANETSTQDLNGEEIPIDGLVDDDMMLELFVDRLESQVPAEALPNILAMCHEKAGNPAQIELLAKEAKKQVRRRRREPPEQVLIEWSAARGRGSGDVAPLVRADPPEQEKALAVADAVDTEVPRDVLADVAGSGSAIDEAVQDGRLEEGSPRYRLNPVLNEPISDTKGGSDDSDKLLGEVFRSTLRWADGALVGELYENRAFVLRMMEWGLESGWKILDQTDDRHAVRRTYVRWKRVIQLGQSSEAAMALGGRHGAWEQLLEYVQVAARANLELATPDDREISRNGAALPASPQDRTPRPAQLASEEDLGWALRQRGARALLRDDLADARVFLNDSLRHGADERGRKLARKNLKLVPLALFPFAALLFLPTFVAAVTATIFVGFDDSPATADITPDVVLFESGQQRQEIEVRNVGDGDIWIEKIEIDDAIDDEDEGFFRIAEEIDDEPGRCREKDQLATDAACTVTVDSRGGSATALLQVTVTSRSDDIDGDRSALLISEE